MFNIISHQEYENQNHNDKPLSHPLGWLKLKKKKNKTDNNNCCQGCGETETLLRCW